jgi:WD40 repeat protein
MRSAAAPLLVLVLTIAACGHEAPFAWSGGGGGPDTLGPFGGEGAVPRRLTFNPGDDRNPSVTGNMLVFSRLDGTHGRERCLAFLAAAGGTLHRTVCPPPASPTDTMIDTWVEPALSPDGRQIAFVWQTGGPASYYTWTRDLVVARVDDPAHPTFAWPSWYVLPDGRTATAVSKPMWLGPTTLRFLASYERVFKVKGGGAIRLTDTATDVYSLADLDLATGTVGVVRGADSTIAYAPVATGGVWLVKSSDSTRLLFLAPGADTAVGVASFSGPVVDIANVAGIPVGLFASGVVVESMDLSTGTVGYIGAVTPIRRIAAVPGTRRFVVEVETTADALASVGANLWLFALP